MTSLSRETQASVDKAIAAGDRMIETFTENQTLVARSRKLADEAWTVLKTKGAVDAITRAFAAELGPRKIRVNAIARTASRLRARAAPES